MCITVPESIKRFSEKHFNKFGKLKPSIMARYITGMLLSTGKRSLTSLGQTVLTDSKFKTTVSKAFRRATFRVREYHESIVKALIIVHIQICGMKGDWHLLIDGVSSKRGANTKIGNFIQYRKKKTSSKGRSTKACIFIQGLLVTPSGIRIPLPRRTYYTKKYCRANGIEFRTLHQITAELIKEVRALIPCEIQLKVEADSFFDSKLIFRTCRENNAVFITPARKSRTYIDGKLRKKLHKRGKHGKKQNDYKTISIVKGKEKWTKEHHRSSTVGQKRFRKFVYRIAGEVLTIPGLGPTLVVYSWKQQSGKKRTFCVLLCSDTEMDIRKVVEFYTLRWQIEVFFRELKSYLGFEDFMGRSFKAFEKFVDLCLISFTFLEWHRIELLRTTSSRKEKYEISEMRTKGLISMIRKESFEELKDYMIVRKDTRRRKKLHDVY